MDDGNISKGKIKKSSIKCFASFLCLVSVLFPIMQQTGHVTSCFDCH